MKNFTNNFKQFTSRLSARWLIMALMMLVGTSSAWGYYVTGWNGDWNPTQYNMEGSNSYTINNVEAGVYEFKITDGTWDKTWGSGCLSSVTGTTVSKVENGDCGNNAKINITAKSNVTIKFTCYECYDKGGASIEVSATAVQVDPCATEFYLAGTFPGLSWTAGESGGQEMVCNDGVYTKTYENVTLEAKKYEYKVTGAKGWNDNEYPSSGNSEYTVDSAGNYDVTFTYVPNTSLSVSLESACSAPSGVSITRTPTTKPCPGTEVTLEANVGEGDVESYSWSVTGTGWSINGNGNTNQTCTFIAGTETGNISLTVSGCSSSDDATTSIEVRARATETDFTVSNNEYTYDGTAKAATVKWSDNQSTEGINITYEPASPIDAGSYDIKVTTSEHGDLCASNEAITLTEKLTITQATQTGFEINNTTLNICGTSVVVTSTGGQGGDVTYTIATDNTTTKDATINSTTGELKVNSAGTVIVTATKGATTNYKVATNSEEFTFIMLPKVALKETSISVCSNEEINLSEYVNEHSGTIKWYSDSEYNTEITELIFTPNPQTYYVKATNGECAPATAALDVSVTQVPSKPTFDPIPAKCDSYTLPTEDKKGLPIKWYETIESVTPLSDNTTVTATGTYYAEGVNGNCVSDSRTAVEVTINATPTITAPSATQTNKEITLTSAAGASTQWSVSPTENVTLTDNGDGTATFVATANGDYTITASNGVCAQVSHTIKVSDAFYIWVRNAKKSDTAYGQFYYPNENSEAVRGGAMFYAECDALPTTDNYTTYNRGGRKADIVNDDCDGYTWYGFKASQEVISGTKYFYVHATNDISNGGYFTHSVPLKVTMSADLYYTLGENGNSYWGWNLATASAPYAGPMVHASGSTTLGTNKFAALYVTDCSGKEIDTYQWEYCSPEGDNYDEYNASVSNSGTLYSGDAGTTNNIRPSVAGFYRCTVKYKGGGTATSAAKEVTGTYSYLESNIPVIVVNTNGVGFPDCPSTGGTASLNADVIKEKRSVDVKIYNGTTLVYDRKARMNYRGSSSLNFQKKSYAFCPGKDNCVEDKGRQDYVKTEKMNMLNVGTAEDKDWVLYASAADPTLMRNRLVFDTYQAMRNMGVTEENKEWGVHSRYVELIVDGEHKGVYVLMDKITKNDNRVKLNEDNGFIVKFDKTDCADRFGGYNNIWGDEKTFKTTYTGYDYVSTYDTHIDQRFEIEYPEKDDYTIGWSSKVKSIQAMFQAFEDALKAGEYATVQKYIDYDSWADWFIINEYTKNVDAYRASCIFVYTGEDGAKIEARPLWDQELSFNNQCPNYMTDYGSNSSDGLLIQNSKVHEQTEKHIAAPFWFTGGGTSITGGLLSDPCFVQIVKEKWSKYSTGSGPLTEDVLMAKIEAYTTELGVAKNREDEYWDSHSRSTLSCSWDDHTTGYNNTDVSPSLDTMTDWFASRGTGLTTAINGLTGASFSIQIVPTDQKVTPWIPAEIAISVEPEGYDYTLEYTGENKLGDIANAIIEKEDNKITYRIPRPDAWETGNAEEGIRADFVYGIKATLNVAEGNMECGTQAAPSSIASITLQDEENDECE